NCQVADSDSGCTHTRTFTITAQDACGNTSSPCTVTYTWTVDTTPPTTTCPTGSDLGCNPATPPTDASVQAQVTAADNCNGTPTITVTHTDSDSGCTHTRIFTAKAKDACGNTSAPCTVTYTWTVDTTPPTITSKPAGGDWGCNPDPSSLPTDASVSAQVTATDNCSGTPTISVTHTETSSSCLTTRTFTITATDGCKNQSSATVVYTWTADTTPPTIVCPVVPPVQLPPDQCAAKVNYAPSARDHCTVASVACVPPSGSPFSPGGTSVTCTATDECGNKASCSFGVTVYSSITVHKFYDANTDGIDNDGQAVAGFKITLSGNPTPQFTDASGNTTFLGLLPGTYTVTEVLPNSKWVNTTGGTSATVNLTCPQKVSFGNV